MSSSDDAQIEANDSVRCAADELRRFSAAALRQAGADEPTADDATAAMMHASVNGVDSHGIRLLPHYVRAIAGGRINGRPQLTFDRRSGATAVVDGDNGHGARVTFFAMDRAVELARRHGVGGVAIRRSSHFGAAGAYACRAAEAGLVGLVVGNSDAFVRLHDGAKAFHGTNPIAFAAPVPGQQPWLLDMSTSAVTYNRVQLYRSLQRPLPEGVASDSDGLPTTDPQAAAILEPLGAAFGFKGAGLAGIVEILSAALSGMLLSGEIAPMAGPDFSTPRHLGAFVLALDPDGFAGREAFDDTMSRYMRRFAEAPAMPGRSVMAPGDREWREGQERARQGIPLDPQTRQGFAEICAQYDVSAPSLLP